MPNSPKTPAMTVRIDQQLQDEVAEFAHERDITKSDVVRESVEDKIGSDAIGHHSCHHAQYAISCEDFDALLKRAGGACEICGVVPRKLWIDHDHEVGQFGVRGLVCPRCNAHMRRIDSGERIPDEATFAYMDNAWHFTAHPGLAERMHEKRVAEWAARKPKPPRRVTQGKRIMSQHSFECEDALWEKARAAAGWRRESVSQVIRAAIIAYVDANYVSPPRHGVPRPHHDTEER